MRRYFNEEQKRQKLKPKFQVCKYKTTAQQGNKIISQIEKEEEVKLPTFMTICTQGLSQGREGEQTSERRNTTDTFFYI